MDLLRGRAQPDAGVLQHMHADCITLALAERPQQSPKGRCGRTKGIKQRTHFWGTNKRDGADWCIFSRLVLVPSGATVALSDKRHPNLNLPQYQFVQLNRFLCFAALNTGISSRVRSPCHSDSESKPKRRIMQSTKATLPHFLENGRSCAVMVLIVEGQLEVGDLSPGIWCGA
eukprot:351344-Chlamydomonas_euryale.AAC.1